MNNTRHYYNFVSNESYLRRRYLPVRRPLGNYNVNELENTRCYAILMHAELEHYFESISLSTAKKAFYGWKIRGETKSSMAALVAFTDANLGELPAKSGKYRDLNNRFEDTYLRFEKLVEENNGIKESNVLKLLLPLGVQERDISSTLLANLNTYGGVRGHFVHSTTTRVSRKQLDPLKIRNYISLISEDLVDLDRKILELWKR